MSLQPLHHGTPQVREALVEQAERVLRAGINGLKPEEFEAMVVRGEVPGAWVDAALEQVMEEPSFAAITMEEFREAMSRVRPDLLSIMASEPGQKWLDKGLRTMAVKLPFRLAGRVFLGR